MKNSGSLVGGNRLVKITDITSEKGEKKTLVGNQLFEHGCNISLKESEEIVNMWKRYGYERIIYAKGMKLNRTDIILFCDRKHFYEGWRFLKENDLLRNTICMMMESPVVDRKCSERILSKIRDMFPVYLTYCDDLVDGCKFYKYWPTVWARPAEPTRELEQIKWCEKGLAAIVCTNQLWDQEPGELYSERKKIIQFFEDHAEYDFGIFGRGWGKYRNCRGTVISKEEAYHPYKFAICLENTRVNGYISEKIFDCFTKGIVPVYGGAYNISSYIPENCYIDYFAFENIKELALYLDAMKEDEYHQYLIHIDEFLKSERYADFGLESQIGRINEAIQKLRYLNHRDKGEECDVF